jgi:hypothetical protein
VIVSRVMDTGRKSGDASRIMTRRLLLTGVDVALKRMPMMTGYSGNSYNDPTPGTVTSPPKDHILTFPSEYSFRKEKLRPVCRDDDAILQYWRDIFHDL